jgi:hypothetical protein
MEVVILTPRPIYLPVKKLPYPLKRRLGGSVTDLNSWEEIKNSFHCRD